MGRSMGLFMAVGGLSKVTDSPWQSVPYLKYILRNLREVTVWLFFVLPLPPQCLLKETAVLTN